jgi:hypothetical protein
MDLRPLTPDQRRQLNGRVITPPEAVIQVTVGTIPDDIQKGIARALSETGCGADPPGGGGPLLTFAVLVRLALVAMLLGGTAAVWLMPVR